MQTKFLLFSFCFHKKRHCTPHQVVGNFLMAIAADPGIAVFRISDSEGDCITVLL